MTARLLRYRFDAIEQVSRHFHVTPERVLFFYPAHVPLRAGDSVILDVTFAASEQQCAVRGAVVGRGASDGWWLEFSAWNVVAGLRSASASPKRRQRRFATKVMVSVHREHAMPAMARLIDVAVGGARVAGLPARAAAGENVKLSFFGADAGAVEIPGRVAWARGTEIGVEFGRLSPEQRAVVRSLVDDARQTLQSAWEAAHPVCCRCAQGGAVVEPPIPRAAHRVGMMR